MNRTAINKLLKEGIGEGEESVWINDNRVWTEIMKKKHGICKGKSVRELVV
jgi:hypothetical protein